MTVFYPGTQRKAFFWANGELTPLAAFDDADLPEGLRPLIEQHTAVFFQWLAAKAAEKKAHAAIHPAEEADRQARAEALRRRKDPPPPIKPEAEAAAKAATGQREDLGLAGAQIEEEIIALVAGNDQWAETIVERLSQQDAAVAASLDVIADAIRDRGRLRWALDIATGAKSLDRHGPVDLQAEATMTAIKAALAEVEMNPEKAIEKAMAL